MKKRTLRLFALSALAVLLFAGGAVQAQSFEEDTFLFEVFAGQYMPGPSFLDDETTFGLRGGFAAGNHWAFVGSFSVVEFDDTVTSGKARVDFEIETFLVDFTANYIFRPDNKVNILVGGGAGGSFSDLDAEISTSDFGIRISNAEDDSFTLNAGVGAVIHLTDLLYLKPEFRARWYETRDDDEIDTEATLALGFKF
jgi:opacity protein-like surface antigen